jgi:hypothetical protein
MNTHHTRAQTATGALVLSTAADAGSTLLVDTVAPHFSSPPRISTQLWAWVVT